MNTLDRAELVKRLLDVQELCVHVMDGKELRAVSAWVLAEEILELIKQ